MDRERAETYLATIPIEGIEPRQVMVAARANDRSRLVAAFRESAPGSTSPGPGRWPSLRRAVP